LAPLACLAVDEAEAEAEVLAALDEEAAVVDALTLLDDPPAPPATPEVVAGLDVVERTEDELAALVVADDTRVALPPEVEALEVTEEVTTATEVAVVLALLDEEPC
jgi:hypothetical protein